MTDLKDSIISSRSIWINKKHAKPKQCQALAEAIVTSNWSSIKHEVSRRNITEVRNKLKACISIVVGSFARQISLGYEPKCFVAIPMGHSSKLAGELTGYTGKDIRLAVKVLEKLHLILCEHKGVNAESITIEGEVAHSSAVSRYKATQTLITLLEEHHMLMPNYPKGLSFKTKKVANLVQVKTAKDNYLQITDDPACSYIEWFREHFDSSRVTLSAMSTEALESTFNLGEKRSKIQPSGKELVRTYSGSTSRYGRFQLSCIQSIPSAARPYLKIDGNQTVELDYRSMHLNLIYHLNGLPIPQGDPYAPPADSGIERDVAKEVFTRMINESNEHAFWSHLKGLVARHGKGVSLKELTKAYDWLIETHPVLESFAFGRSKKDLFLEESKIALHVLEQLQEQDILALPIHESFIVKRKYEQQLREVMEIAFPGCPIH